ncbi:hypothetical protein N431DRAFT_437355 [Stipitochalara longipes BDJ]|nr:hypothetical protein N431DRAFT_437355 [Stipitochalara longipes BDJ]
MADGPPTITGRLRKASVTAADALLNFNPQPGMWAATGTAIAYAPTLTELREPVAGGENIEFNAQGHSARTVVRDEEGEHVLGSVLSRTGTKGGILGNMQTQTRGSRREGEKKERDSERGEEEGEKPTLAAQAALHVDSQEKHNWKATTKHGFTAAWKFVSSLTGFFMTLI